MSEQAMAPAGVHTWYEPYGGMIACALRVLDVHCSPPAALMGNKRRLAPKLLAIAGVRAGARLRIHVSDAGPCGAAWRDLVRPGMCSAVAMQLRAWSMDNPIELWDSLAGVPPYPERPKAIAQWLWLQARSANNCPVWWDEALHAWRMGDKPRNGRVKDARQRGHWRRLEQSGSGWRPGAQRIQGQGCELRANASGVVGRCRGMIHTATIAGRLDRLAHALEGAQVRVVAGDAVRHAPRGDLTGTIAYLDPSYVNKTGYPVNETRRRALAFARRLQRAGALVMVSEAVPLDALGWESVQIAPDEWVTCSFRPHWRPPEQLALCPLVERADVGEPARAARSWRGPTPTEPAGHQLDLFPEQTECP